MDSLDKRSLHDEGFPEAADLMFANSGGCCCFFPPCSRRRTPASTPTGCWGRIGTAASAVGIASGSAVGWWGRGIRALMKVREWSEFVAGPRWKTFIRRFNRHSRCPRLGRRFQYDPLSYALNFDDGFTGSGSPEAHAGFRDFSSHYAVPPTAARLAVDFAGGNESPSLFPAVPSVTVVSVVR